MGLTVWGDPVGVVLGVTVVVSGEFLVVFLRSVFFILWFLSPGLQLRCYVADALRVCSFGFVKRHSFGRLLFVP